MRSAPVKCSGAPVFHSAARRTELRASLRSDGDGLIISLFIGRVLASEKFETTTEINLYVLYTGLQSITTCNYG